MHLRRLLKGGLMTDAEVVSTNLFDKLTTFVFQTQLLLWFNALFTVRFVVISVRRWLFFRLVLIIREWIFLKKIHRTAGILIVVVVLIFFIDSRLWWLWGKRGRV